MFVYMYGTWSSHEKRVQFEPVLAVSCLCKNIANFESRPIIRYTYKYRLLCRYFRFILRFIHMSVQTKDGIFDFEIIFFRFLFMGAVYGQNVSFEEMTMNTNTLSYMAMIILQLVSCFRISNNHDTF